MIILNKTMKKSKIKSLFSGFFDKWFEKLLIGFSTAILVTLLSYIVIVLFFWDIKFTICFISFSAVFYILGHFIMKWRDNNGSTNSHDD